MEHDPPPPNPRRQPSVLADGHKLRAFRRARGLTQLELAMLAGVSERTVRSAETGTRIKLDVLDRLVAELKVELVEAVSDQEELRNAMLVNSNVDRILQTYAAYIEEWDLGPLRELALPQVTIDVLMTEELLCTGRFRGIDEIERLRDEASALFEPYSQEFEVQEIRAHGPLVIISGEDVLHNVGKYQEVRMQSTLIFTFNKTHLERVEHFTNSHAFFKCLRDQ